MPGFPFIMTSMFADAPGDGIWYVLYAVLYLLMLIAAAGTV